MPTTLLRTGKAGNGVTAWKPLVGGLVAFLALAAIGIALFRLIAATAGLIVETIDIAGTPATLFRSSEGFITPAPVV